MFAFRHVYLHNIQDIRVERYNLIFTNINDCLLAKTWSLWLQNFLGAKITKKIKYRKKKRVKNKTLKLLPVEFRGILLAKQQNLLIS